MGSLKSYVWGSLTALLFLTLSIRLTSRFLNISDKVGEIKIGPTVEQIGVKLLTDHVLMFEFSSVLLLGALIGTAIISRPSKENFFKEKAIMGLFSYLLISLLLFCLWCYCDDFKKKYHCHDARDRAYS